MRRPFLRIAAVTIVGLLALLRPGLSSAVPAQIDPRTALLEKAGWDAIAAGQARTAAAAFREALVADPKNPQLYLGAATAAYIERRNEDARDALDRALALDPKLTRARALLGQVLHRMGDVPGAIRAYEALTAETPDDKEAVATLERWRRESQLHDRMQQTVGAHFTVAFEGPAEEAIAAGALASLERAYWRIGDVPRHVSGRSDSRRPLHDRAVPRHHALAGVGGGRVRRHHPRADARRARQSRRSSTACSRTSSRTRSSAGLAARGVPTWLNEGLATALEADDLTWARAACKTRRRRGSAERPERGFGQLSATDAQLAYATSALAVRRLLEEAGGFAIANLLRDLGDGVDFDTAFLHRIQRPFADFQAAGARGF